MRGKKVLTTRHSLSAPACFALVVLQAAIQPASPTIAGGPHLVWVLDVGLSSKDGYEAIRRLRDEECCRDSLFIAVTGYGQEVDLRRSEEAGFDHHMVKPIDYQALMTVIAHAD